MIFIIGELEFYYFWIYRIKMEILVCVIANFFKWWLELSDVDSSGAHIVVDVGSEGLEVVVWIFALSEILPELVVLRCL